MNFTIKNRILILYFFLLPFISLSNTETPIVSKGVLDLTKYHFEENGNISLQGEWIFYWQKFLKFEQIKNDTNYAFLMVPKKWENQEYKNEKLPLFGYGTYYLQIILNKEYLNEIFSLKCRYIPNSSKIYINDKLIGFGGILGETKEKTTPSMDINLNNFLISSDTLNLVIQVSNYHLNKGGIYYDIELGKSKDINYSNLIFETTTYFILGSIFLMVLYYLILFLLRKKEKQSLYFSILCLFIGLYTLCLSKFYFSIFPFSNFGFDFKLKHITIYFALLSMGLYIYKLFKEEFKLSFLKIIVIVSSLFALLMLFLNTYLNSILFNYFRYFGIISTLYVIYVIIKAQINKREGAKIFILGLLIILLAVLNDTLLSMGKISSINLLPVAMFLFLILQTYVLSSRFTKSFAKTEALTNELTYINKNLEKIVDERTQEISYQKHEIEEKNEELKQLVEEVTAQRDQIEEQRDIVIQQKDHIEEIHREVTDSINYAKRIQTSALPNLEQVLKHFSDIFVLFKPKDVVSGDFYWLAEVENQIIITVADCTGHGVPGAFMSMLGMSMLKEIVVNEYVTQPDVILKKLRKEVIKALRQTGKTGEQKDGMDMSLCSINTQTYELQWAGANNPCWIVKNGVFTEIKADKMPIAIYEKMDKFTLHKVQLEKGDTIYLVGDGYPDQFGGPKGKKFMSKNLKQLLLEISNQPLEKQLDILENTITKWMDSDGIKYEQTDDITVMGIKI